jgi:hypothetical protein
MSRVLKALAAGLEFAESNGIPKELLYSDPNAVKHSNLFSS